MRSYLKWPVALLLAVFVLAGCESQPEERVVGFDGQTMGTSFSVRWVDTTEDRIQPIKSAIGKRLAAINLQMSTYLPNSELSQFNELPEGSGQQVSTELAELVAESIELSERSEGAFDVTVGPLVNLWGFGPEGRPTEIPSDDEIEALRARIGYQKLSVDLEASRIRKQSDLYVDLSAIAKGFGVDEMASVLEAQGIRAYLVEIGGELRASGLKPDGSAWRIAIESPVSGERSIGRIIEVRDTGIATSGDYRNYFEEGGVRYSHTIDPTTGRPISHRLASVTVLHPSCAQADALATTLMVMGEERGREFAEKNGIAAYFVVKNSEGEGFVEFATPEFEQFVQTEES